MLKVGDFVLNTASRKLYDKDKKEVSLAPTLFTLLKFFVDHQNQVCSKDMIIDHVWKGKIVVEANVNQNIKKLRDVLGDSVNNPTYIETVTGKGFRFIANSEEYRATPQTESKKLNKILFPLFLIILVISFLFYRYVPTNEVNNLTIIKELHPLTTLKGWEHYPDVSQDGKYLLFSHKYGEQAWNIFLKPLNRESYHPIIETENKDMFPVLSPAQSKLIYFSKGRNRCGLYIRDIKLETSQVSEERELKKCPMPNSRIKAEWIDEKEVFISINEDLKSPASIYQFNIVNNRQKLISKPDSKGFGDYALSFSSKNNKLAYIRNIGWSSSEIWVYDLIENYHQKIKTTPLLLTEIDWLNSEWLIYQSGNKEISKINHNGTEEQIVAKFLTKVYFPFVIDDKSIGVVQGEYTVSDVSSFDMESKELKTLISSSSNDYFAFGNSGYFVFVSDRTGDPQVWLRDSLGNNTQLTNFQKSFEISELSADFNNNLIIFNKSGHINIIDKKGTLIFDSENYSNNVHNNPVLDLENDRFLYSVQLEGEWNIESRKISSPGEKIGLFKGVSARPCIKQNCIYYLKDNDTKLYKYIPQSNTSQPVAEIGKLLKINEWDVFDRHHILYLQKDKAKNKIIKLNLSDSSKQLIFESNAKMFSLDKTTHTLYSNIVSKGNTDIMRFDL